MTDKNAIFRAYQDKAQAPLETATSLPFAVYGDPDVHNVELERIFGNEWVFVVSAQEIPEIGDYFAVTIANEPIVVLRGKDNVIRALSNICRHRGTPLLDEGFGKVDKHIGCPYHAWTYNDQGALHAAPVVGDVQLEKVQHGLPSFKLEAWQGLLFVHLGQPAHSLGQRLAGIDAYLAYYDLPAFQYGYRSEQVERWTTNWKLAMENAMESYHLFKVHKDTLETVTPTRSAFHIAGSAEWSLTGGGMIDNAGALTKWFRGDYLKVYDHYVLISIPPSFVGILTYESLSWIQVLPIDSTHCSVRSAGISNEKAAASDSAEQVFVEAFFAEDKVICERVQRGMKSTRAKGGKLVSMEKIVVDFHQFLANRLFGSEQSDFVETPEAELFLN